MMQSTMNGSPSPSQPHLWQFLLDMLLDGSHRGIIDWSDPATKEFYFIDANEVARLWGMRKNKWNMNYDKLSRALRYYYAQEILRKVEGKRYHYQFLNLPQPYAGITIPNADSAANPERGSAVLGTRVVVPRREEDAKDVKMEIEGQPLKEPVHENLVPCCQPPSMPTEAVAGPSQPSDPIDLSSKPRLQKIKPEPLTLDYQMESNRGLHALPASPRHAKTQPITPKATKASPPVFPNYLHGIASPFLGPPATSPMFGSPTIPTMSVFDWNLAIASLISSPGLFATPASFPLPPHPHGASTGGPPSTQQQPHVPASSYSIPPGYPQSQVFSFEPTVAPNGTSLPQSTSGFSSLPSVVP